MDEEFQKAIVSAWSKAEGDKALQQKLKRDRANGLLVAFFLFWCFPKRPRRGIVSKTTFEAFF